MLTGPGSAVPLQETSHLQVSDRLQEMLPYRLVPRHCNFHLAQLKQLMLYSQCLVAKHNLMSQFSHRSCTAMACLIWCLQFPGRTLLQQGSGSGTAGDKGGDIGKNKGGVIEGCKGTTYTVKAGDTLSELQTKHWREQQSALYKRLHRQTRLTM